MANYLGYGLHAGVQGFQTGFNMAQQKSEMEWQKLQKKKLEEKELKIKEGAALYSNLIKQYGADNVYSEDEIMQLNTAFLSAGYEVQAVIKDTHNAIQTMDKNKLEQDLAWLDLFADLTEGLDPKDVQGTFDMIKGNVKSEKGINLFDAYGSLQTKKYEVAEKEKPWEKAAVLPAEMRAPYLEQEGIKMPEVAPEAPSMADEKSAITLLKTFVNATPEQFNAQRTRIEQNTGLDLSVYTQDILKETGSEMYNLYNTPEEVMSNVKAPAGLTVIPKRDTKTGKYYGSFSKETTTGIAPEGEVTAGEKRTFDMASSVMFGSSDWVTGISKPGIISQSISNKLNMGDKLTEEENTEVRNNYNAIKDTLPEEIRSVVESQLQRYGVSLEAPPEAEVILDIKKKPFWQSDQKYYGGLKVEELYQLADKEDDKKAYEELKKRGLIK